MTSPYRAMCAELVDSLHKHTSMWEGHEIDLVTRARALLDQPEPKESKPVVDYSRVPEIATGAQIRSAAQYLVKKRNCDGDLIPAIEYAIARWGHPTPQSEPEGPEGSYFTDGDYNREIHYAWELEDAEGEWQAGGSANRLDDVRQEGSHYLQTYSQDGPHKLIIQRHCLSTIEEVTND